MLMIQIIINPIQWSKCKRMGVSVTTVHPKCCIRKPTANRLLEIIHSGIVMIYCHLEILVHHKVLSTPIAKSLNGSLGLKPSRRWGKVQGKSRSSVRLSPDQNKSISLGRYQLLWSKTKAGESISTYSWRRG